MTGEVRGGARLDPFALPSETGVRFVLLILAVGAATASVYGQLWLTSDAYDEAASDCRPFGLPLGTPPTEAALSAQDACLTPLAQRTAVWMLAGLILVGIVAFGIYRTWPELKLWWDRLKPLREADAPGIPAHLETLVRAAGVSPAPAFVWNPVNAMTAAVAFGRRSQPYVRLGGGLVARFYADRPGFDAIVGHELAHLRNGDVVRTYGAIAVWRAFILICGVPILLGWVVPMLRGFSLHDQREALPDLLAHSIALGLLVLLTRNALLRARELYADLRTARVPDQGAALRRLLAAMPAAPRAGRRALLRVHPSPDERRRVLDDSSPLFVMGFWEPFAAGAAATVALASLAALIAALTGSPVDGTAGPPPDSAIAAAALVAATPAGAVVAIGAWRAAVAWSVGIRVRSSAVSGLGLGLGALVGEGLAFFELGWDLFPDGSGATARQAAAATWGLVFVAASVLFALAAASGASWWVARQRSLPAGRRRIAVALLPGGLAFAMLSAAFLVAAAPLDRALRRDDDVRTILEPILRPGQPVDAGADRVFRVGRTAVGEALQDLWLLVPLVSLLVVLTLAAVLGAIGRRRGERPSTVRAPVPAPAPTPAPAPRSGVRVRPLGHVRSLVREGRIMPAEVVGALAGVALFGLTFLDWYGGENAYESYSYTKQALIVAALLPCLVLTLRGAAARLAASRLGLTRAAARSIVGSPAPDVAVIATALTTLTLVTASPGSDPVVSLGTPATLGVGLLGGVAALACIAASGCAALVQVRRRGRAAPHARRLTAAAWQHGAVAGELVAAVAAPLLLSSLFLNWHWDDSAWHAYDAATYGLVLPVGIAFALVIPPAARGRFLAAVRHALPVAAGATAVVTAAIWVTTRDLAATWGRVEPYAPIPVAAVAAAVLVVAARSRIVADALLLGAAAAALALLPTERNWDPPAEWSAGVHLGVWALVLIGLAALGAVVRRALPHLLAHRRDRSHVLH